jgi:hypothetical protein
MTLDVLIYEHPLDLAGRASSPAITRTRMVMLPGHHL